MTDMILDTPLFMMHCFCYLLWIMIRYWKSKIGLSVAVKHITKAEISFRVMNHIVLILILSSTVNEWCHLAVLTRDLRAWNSTPYSLGYDLMLWMVTWIQPEFPTQVFQSLREKCPYSDFSWSVFSRIRTEYGETLSRIYPSNFNVR